MIIKTDYYHVCTTMENTHTSHSCLQLHKNFHTRLSSNKTLLLLAIEPFGLQKIVQAWMKHQSGKTLMPIIPNCFYWKKNCFDSCFIKTSGKITSGCVLLIINIAFKSCTCHSTSKFVKRRPSSSTFGAS
jgi:hypothetical protein